MPAIKLNKTSFVTVVLVLSYYFTGPLPFAATTVGSFLYFFLVRRKSRKAVEAAGVPALFAVFLIALVSTIMPTDFPISIRSILRDSYFMIAPVILMISGLLLLRSEIEFKRATLAAAYSLTFSSIVIYQDFLFSGGLSEVSLDSRYNYNLNSSASTLALILIISLHPKASLVLQKPSAIVLILMNLLLIILSLSRVDIAIALSSLVIVYSPLKWVKIFTIAFILFLTTAPLIPTIGSMYAPALSGNLSFRDKALRSLSEFRISDYTDMSDINNNWRGYEAYLGIAKVEQSGNLASIIGTGLGSYVEGPFEEELRNIPFFHNGFVTIYLKSGFMGLFAFAFFIFRLYRLAWVSGLKGRQTDDLHLVRASVMINILTSALLLQTLATHGVYYLKPTLGILFIGFAISSLQFSRFRSGCIR